MLTVPTSARASEQLAAHFGCLSCHGAYPRDEAPSLERLSAKLAKFKGDAAAEAKFVTQYRAGEMFGHIDAHERLSPDAASALVHWLVEGGK
jgi:cytochrome c551/c552